MLECSSPFWCACEGTLTSHPTPPQMRMLMNMSASHCDWTSLFCARVSAHSVVRMWKNVNIPPHPTPHYTTPAHMRMLMNMNVISQGVGWLLAVSVRKWVNFMSLSAQVRKFPWASECVFWNRVALAKTFDRLLNPWTMPSSWHVPFPDMSMHGWKIPKNRGWEDYQTKWAIFLAGHLWYWLNRINEGIHQNLPHHQPHHGWDQLFSWPLSVSFVTGKPGTSLMSYWHQSPGPICCSSRPRCDTRGHGTRIEQLENTRDSGPKKMGI